VVKTFFSDPCWATLPLSHFSDLREALPHRRQASLESASGGGLWKRTKKTVGGEVRLVLQMQSDEYMTEKSTPRSTSLKITHALEYQVDNRSASICRMSRSTAASQGNGPC
jgi:hypothetical protein